MSGYRTETDLLGTVQVRADARHGIHTVRAAENFALAGRATDAQLARAYGLVKLACVRTNRALGWWSTDAAKADAMERACEELAEGKLAAEILVDALQGGAGTSLNMNVNEVVANRALELLGDPPGNYQRVHPLDDINLHQSTNDTFPTALRLAAIWCLRDLEREVVALQESFQAAEKRFAGVVKVGRTEMQDAVLTTVGRSMGAFAEALNRDRWRIYKCEERLRVVNLGGTAIGTGLAAPREYIFQVVDQLRELSGIGFARAENLVEATQNADVFAEVSGILKAHAVSLLKICTDLRWMSSGPEAGLGELRLPARQAGSSVMPGKVNPVIPEAVCQVAMRVMGLDVALSQACAAGSLELNPFLPLIAECLLDSLQSLTRANRDLRRFCVDGLEVNAARCAAHVGNSTAALTALVPELGYEQSARVAELASQQGTSLRETVIQLGWMKGDRFDALLAPETVCRLGHPLPGTFTEEHVA